MNTSEPSQRPGEPPKVRADLKKPPPGKGSRDTPTVPPPSAAGGSGGGPKRVSPYPALSHSEVKERQVTNSPRRTHENSPDSSKQPAPAAQRAAADTSTSSPTNGAVPPAAPRRIPQQETKSMSDSQQTPADTPDTSSTNNTAPPPPDPGTKKEKSSQPPPSTSSGAVTATQQEPVHRERSHSELTSSEPTTSTPPPAAAQKTIRERQTTAHLNADEPLIQLQQEILVLQSVVKRRQEEGGKIRLRIQEKSAELVVPTRRSVTPDVDANEIDHLERQLVKANQRNRALKEKHTFYQSQRDESFRLRSLMTGSDSILDDLESIVAEVPEPRSGLHGAYSVLSDSIVCSEEAKRRLDADLEKHEETKNETAVLHEACIQAIADAERRYDPNALRKRMSGRRSVSGGSSRNESNQRARSQHEPVPQDEAEPTHVSNSVKFASRGKQRHTHKEPEIRWDPTTALGHRIAEEI